MRRLMLAATLAAFSLGLVAVASAGTTGGRSSTFTDPTGDAGTAADITTVAVSNDATGQITFQVNVASPFTATQSVDILVDADRNSSTGDPNADGAEYDLYQDFSNHSWDVQTWNGSAWAEAASYSTVKVNYTSNQYTFSINKSELGDTTSFGFWLDSCDGDCSAGHEDQAPASGTWAYQIATAVHLTVAYALTPKTVKAGQVYTAALLVQRSDTSAFLGNEGTVKCKAAVGGRPVAAAGGFFSQTYQGTKVTAAVCAARAPKTARGKTLTGTITVSYQGATVSRNFSARIS